MVLTGGILDDIHFDSMQQSVELYQGNGIEMAGHSVLTLWGRDLLQSLRSSGTQTSPISIHTHEVVSK